MLHPVGPRVSALLCTITLLLVIGADATLAAGKTVVRVASWWASEGFLNELKAAFEAQNPDIAIEYETIATGYYTKLPTEILGGNPPDVAMLGFSSIAAYAETGLAQDIDNLVRGSYPVNELYPSVQRALQYKGHYYALPRDTTSNLLFYNKAHLAASGIAYPTDNWTWDDFTLAARKLTTGNRYGFITDYVLDGYYHWFSTNSADWFNEDRTLITIDSTRSVETLNFLRGLIYDQQVMPGRATASQMGGGPKSFQNQTASMFVGAVANAYGWQDSPDISWDVAMLPKNTQPGTRIWANLWIMPAGAKNKEAAWRVLSFFAGTEGQRIVLKMKTGIPATRRLAASFDLAIEHKSYFMQAFEVGIPYPVIPQDPVWTVFNEQLPKFWDNQISARQAAEVIKEKGQAMM